MTPRWEREVAANDLNPCEVETRKKAGRWVSTYYYSRKQRIQEFPSVISQIMRSSYFNHTSLTNRPQHDSSNSHSNLMLRGLPTSPQATMTSSYMLQEE